MAEPPLCKPTLLPSLEYGEELSPYFDVSMKGTPGALVVSYTMYNLRVGSSDKQGFTYHFADANGKVMGAAPEPITTLKAFIKWVEFHVGGELIPSFEGIEEEDVRVEITNYADESQPIKEADRGSPQQLRRFSVTVKLTHEPEQTEEVTPLRTTPE